MKAKYIANWHIDFGGGKEANADDVLVLSNEEAAPLLAVGAITKESDKAAEAKSDE